MNQETPPTPQPAPPYAVTAPASHSYISLIWIVPAIAVLVAIGLGIHALLQRGPEITVQISSAEGLEANKTKVKYKEVEIGTVKAIALTEDRRSVRVTVEMDKQAAPLLVDDSRFWVVRPRIGAGGVSGLGTLLSGAYLALDPGHSPTARRSFSGLDTPPLVVSGMPGSQYLLTAADLGSVDVGVLVYYRRIPVGRVVGYALRPDGSAIDVRIFIDAPYDRFVTSGTRFWHASGIDVSLSAEGVKLQTQALASLVIGGIAFADIEKEGASATGSAQTPAESRFTLYPDRAEAFRQPDTLVQKYLLVFDESVRGLSVGAPVDYRGMVAGEVSRIDLAMRHDTDAAMAVEINLYPERFARQSRAIPANKLTPAALRQILDDMVAKGFRAQLQTGNLLTGQRYVALDFFPKAKAARVKWGQSMPELPTQPGTLDSLQEQVQGVMETLQKTLLHADQLVAHIDREVTPELTATLRDARVTLKQANDVLASDSPTQVQLRDALRELGRAAASLRNLTDMLERHPESLVTGRKTSK